MSSPISVAWSITNRCQSLCKYCCTDSHSEADPGLSLSASRSIVDRLAEWGVLRLNIGGGEPLLHPTCVEILEWAAAAGAKPTLSTNGLALKKADVERIAAAVMVVQVSLDSLREEVYRELRGTPNGVSAVLRGIRECTRRGAPVRVATVLTRFNEGELEALAECLASEGVQQWLLLSLQSSGRGRDSHAALSAEATGAVERLALLEAKYPSLSIAFWGDRPPDKVSINLASTGHLRLHDYDAGKGPEIAHVPSLSSADLVDAWSRISPDAMHSTLQNFTSATRRPAARQSP